MKWNKRKSGFWGVAMLLLTAAACQQNGSAVSSPSDIRLKMPERPAAQATAPENTISTAAVKPKTLTEQGNKYRIDPFKPLFIAPVGEDKRPVIGSKPMTLPFDLSQYRLTGVLKGRGGALALVEDAAGRGHVLSPGRVFVDQSMVVMSVQDTRVLFEERYTDTEGNERTRQRELKLESPKTRQSS